MNKNMSGAQIVVEALLEQKVDTVFGYPGGAVLPIYDEIFKTDIIFVCKIDNVIIGTAKLLIEQKFIHNLSKYGRIEDVIVNFEPRVNLSGITCIPNFDNNRFDVIIEFYLINAPSELVDITFALERLR